MASLRGCPLCNGSGTLGRTRVRYAAIMDAFTDRGIIGPDILRLARATEEEGRRLSPVRTGRMRNLHYRVVLPPRGYERDFYVGTKAGYAHFVIDGTANKGAGFIRPTNHKELELRPIPYSWFRPDSAGRFQKQVRGQKPQRDERGRWWLQEAVANVVTGFMRNPVGGRR